MGISVNGPSGIDTQYIIDSLVSIEQTKVTAVQNQKKAYQLKIDGYSKFETLLGDLQGKAQNLSEISSFDLFNTTSSNEDIVTVTAGTGSVDGTYDVKVFQMAGNEKMISADQLITDQTATLESLGIGIGTFSINGSEIEIDSTDTLQDLRQKINTATDENGIRLDVSASVLKITDDNFRLILTSKNSGSEGVSYQDVSGSVLQDLGIIATADGDKGTTSQVLTSSQDLQSAWSGLAEGETIEITARDHNGNDVVASIIKRAGDGDEELLDGIKNAFNGMVDASLDGTGQLVITDKVEGNSLLSISDMTAGATAVDFTTTYGDTGAGVLSTGRDAYFSVESIYMSSSSNSATGFVSGVTFDFNGVSKDDESVAISLERDQEAIRGKFQEMIDAYNAILRYSKNSTKIADPTDENATSGVLAGDSTVRSITSRINAFFHQQFDELNSSITSFTMLGVKTNTANGELEVDEEMFEKALTERFDEVVNLFVTVGTSDNNGIVLGTKSAETQSGTYVFEEVDASHFRARLASGTTWYDSDARVGEIISFSEGPLEGLSVTAPEGTIGAGSATFTLSKGLATIIDDSIANITDAHDGLVALRTESYNQSIRRADDKISQLEERVEKFRLRLVNQFSAMEQAMSQLQSQSANMLSQLGSSISTSSSS